MTSADLPRNLVAADHVVFLVMLSLNCALGGVFVLRFVQYLRLRRGAEEREARLLSTPLAPAAILPKVLIQLPAFDEGPLIARLCQAVGRFEWPRERLAVQILDDSTDGGQREARCAAQALRRLGVEAEVLSRPENRGFKAGALAEGLQRSDAAFVAIFDADYVPAPDVLARCMRPLIADAGLAFVQARCDYLNGDENALTRAQQRILDAHYAIEQPVRCWTGQMLPFNGTCGVWRRAAIDDAGGWDGDTLAEDMDLSFRAQFRGWRALFLGSVVVPGELPATLEAWRRQQFRWTKGTAEVTRKLSAQVWASRLGPARKFGAALQLCGGVFGLSFGLTLGLGLIDVILRRGLTLGACLLLALLIVEVVGGTILLQVAAQTCVRGGRVLGELALAPKTLAFQALVGLLNLGGAFEGLAARRTDFERTPKGRKGV